VSATRPTSPRSRGQFLDYVADPARLPAWENANLLAKYWLTTHGVQAASYFTNS
jgi:hypothetical protein